MRRIIVVIATVIVAHLTVSAQTDFKKIIINDADLARNQNLMTVSMDFDFSAFNVGVSSPAMSPLFYIYNSSFFQILISTKLINCFNFRLFGIKFFGYLALICSVVWQIVWLSE